MAMVAMGIIRMDMRVRNRNLERFHGPNEIVWFEFFINCWKLFMWLSLIHSMNSERIENTELIIFSF